MMLDKAVLADIMPYVSEKHFYDLKNAVIWRHMVKIASRGETPDLGIVFEWRILLPILGLWLLAVLPIILKTFSSKKDMP